MAGGPGGIVIGWQHREWAFPVLCRRCRRIITAGTTHVYDHDDPPRNALCRGCFDTIMAPGFDHDDDAAAN